MDIHGHATDENVHPTGDCIFCPGNGSDPDLARWSVQPVPIRSVKQRLHRGNIEFRHLDTGLAIHLQNRPEDLILNSDRNRVPEAAREGNPLDDSGCPVPES